MPRFRVVMEETMQHVFEKVIEAESMDAARAKAEAELNDWLADGWEEISASRSDEFREDLSEEVKEDD